VTQWFSLDGTVPPLQLFPELLLLTDLKSLFQMEFMFLWLTLLGSLILSWLDNGQSLYFYALVRTRSVFLPLILYIIYFGIC